MEQDDYKNAYQAARAEMDHLLHQRVAIDKRLSQLKYTMDGLRLLLDVPENRVPLDRFETEDGTVVPLGGISDAIRSLLTARKVAMSPPEIKMALSKQGFDFSGYANALSVIHNTLKRLERQGEITPVRNPAGEAIAYAIVGKGVPTSLKGLVANAMLPRAGNVTGPTSAYDSGMRGTEKPKK